MLDQDQKTYYTPAKYMLTFISDFHTSKQPQIINAGQGEGERKNREGNVKKGKEN